MLAGPPGLVGVFQAAPPQRHRRLLYCLEARARRVVRIHVPPALKLLLVFGILRSFPLSLARLNLHS